MTTLEHLRNMQTKIEHKDTSILHRGIAYYLCEKAKRAVLRQPPARIVPLIQPMLNELPG
jgi:hypothetical protein